MFQGPRTQSIAVIACLALCPPAAMAQVHRTWVDPPSNELQASQAEPAELSEPAPEAAGQRSGENGSALTSSTNWAESIDVSESEPTRPSIVAPVYTATASDPLHGREKAARDLAFTYLSVWSAPNRVALASAPSFYGPTVRFHRQVRTIGSILAEKRRFAERWPDRHYRYRPATTRVSCQPRGTQCIVRSSFDFSASNPHRRRRSQGIGEHELVVSFSGSRPVIAAEDSRILQRGFHH
jgi:hypothetical protein